MSDSGTRSAGDVPPQHSVGDERGSVAPPGSGPPAPDGPAGRHAPDPGKGGTGDRDGDGDGKPERGCIGAAVGFVADRGIPLLIAVLGLIAALATTWGAVVKADADDVEEANGALERQIEALEEENSGLTDDVERLTEERDRWRDQAQDDPGPTTTQARGSDGAGESETPVTTPAGSRDSTVRRQTGTVPLTFASNYSVDLDTDAPDWGVREGSGGDLYFYLGSSSTSLPRLFSGGEVSIVDHVPTEAECDDATVRQPDIDEDQTREGLQICTLTDQDHFAYVRIASIDEEAKTITLDITVWE